eukprot:197961_1
MGTRLKFLTGFLLILFKSNHVMGDSYCGDVDRDAAHSHAHPEASVHRHARDTFADSTQSYYGNSDASAQSRNRPSFDPNSVADLIESKMNLAARIITNQGEVAFDKLQDIINVVGSISDNLGLNSTGFNNELEIVADDMQTSIDNIGKGVHDLGKLIGEEIRKIPWDHITQQAVDNWNTIMGSFTTAFNVILDQLRRFETRASLDYRRALTALTSTQRVLQAFSESLQASVGGNADDFTRHMNTRLGDFKDNTSSSIGSNRRKQQPPLLGGAQRILDEFASALSSIRDGFHEDPEEEDDEFGYDDDTSPM